MRERTNDRVIKRETVREKEREKCVRNEEERRQATTKPKRKGETGGHAGEEIGNK